jgi:hypothetical protein
LATAFSFAVGAIPLRCRDKSPDRRKTRTFWTDARLVLFYNWQNRAFSTKSTSRIFDEKLTPAHKLKERSCRLRTRAAQHGNRLYVLGSSERRIELEGKPLFCRQTPTSKKAKNEQRACTLNHRRIRDRAQKIRLDHHAFIGHNN